MSRNVVVVGSCMIDFTVYSSRLPKPGETLVGKTFVRGNGGKGANQCIAASKLGASTALVASLGDDIFGKEYIEILKSINIDVSNVRLQEGIHSGIAQIVVADDGENSIVVVEGANALLLPEHVDEAADLIRNASVLVCQFEVPVKTTLRALKLRKGYGISILNGAPAVTDPDPELFRACDIFCVNETEAEEITGIRPITIDNARDAIDLLLDKGCKEIILTLGAAGAIYANSSKKEVAHVPTEKVQPVDTTGAGDAFVGSLAYFKAYHPELPMIEIVRRACHVATLSVMKLGTNASFPTKRDLSEEWFL